MSTPDPSVAIIIAAYNARATIARAVSSALADQAVAEVVVVDDCSRDDTAAVAQACDDGTGRLKVLRQAENGGPGAARNRAIVESVSPWLAVLDADDFLLPGRMGKLLALALEGWDFVADDLLRVPEGAEDGPRKAIWFGDESADTELTLTSFIEACIPDPKRARGELAFLKPLMSRAFLKRNGIAYRPEVRLGEDFELYARALAAKARFRLVSALGYVSVVRPNSLSGAHTPEDLLQFREVDTRLLSEFALTPAEAALVRRHRVSTDQRLQWRLLIEAVKTRSVPAILRPFGRGPQVAGYLAARLMEQVAVRSGRALGFVRAT